MRFKNLYRVLLVSLWVFARAKEGALDFAIAQKAFKSENYTKALEYYQKAEGKADGYYLLGDAYKDKDFPTDWRWVTHQDCAKAEHLKQTIYSHSKTKH
ncbi:hypothetical protein [Helicobacter mehlei]|uniref:Beta-lactamase n=1 Tax=Helicobacter mehlei TaxID=2316080 RepID=A0A553UIG7_9HELI|nr:hypothetical protein [Helicobacter mehlei]TSA79982.1 hypothetical protein FNE76_07675 [Helicobacter mehlei]